MSHKPLAKVNPATLNERQRRIATFLDSMRVGVLTSVDPSGDPHGSVIYFTVNKDFVLCFLTKANTKKADNILRNNRVMLVVFDPGTQTVAQVIGKTVQITDHYTLNAVSAEIYMTSIRNAKDLPPITKFEAGDYVGFRIEPDQIRMAAYATPESGDHGRIFDSIESFELET